MSIQNKTKMMAALSLFQVISATASASEITKVMIAQDAKQVVVCKVDKLGGSDSQNWGNFVIGEHKGRNAEATLNNINKDFAGGNYFDSYPHKLPDLFKKGACLTVKK